MSHSRSTSTPLHATGSQADTVSLSGCDEPLRSEEDLREEEKEEHLLAAQPISDDSVRGEAKRTTAGESDNEDATNQDPGPGDEPTTGADDSRTTTRGVRQRPRLTTSNSGAEIMLGLETDEGKTAEVEIDSLETDELQPEEIPKGRVRRTSIVEKLSKSKESELMALSILENAGQRQREFEKLISEHQELVQEISRTPSTENIVQSDTGRDP